MPRSLAGSEVDGDAGVDAHGALRVDRALRRLFDWHRAASGELGEAQILQWLTATLEQKLPPAAVAEALRIYGDYLAYLRASDSIVIAHDPLAQLDDLHHLRVQILGEQVADAFFGDEELAQMARLERRRIMNDPALDEAERLARLRAYDERLPDELKPEGELEIAQQAEALSRAYDANATDPAERHRERAALLGEEAADRLGTLDAEREAWQQRMDAYAAERARLYADPRLADRERERMLAQWAASRFDEAELRRLLALSDANGG